MSWLKRKDFLEERAKPWELVLAVFLSGIIMAFSQPTVLPGMKSPIEPQILFSLLAYIGLIPVYRYIWDKSFKRSFLLGFFAGLVYFIISIYWVVIAMNVYGGLSYPVSILGLVLLSGFCAFFWGGGLACAEFFRKQLKIPIYIALPVSWTAFEYFRNYLFTGFPWSQLGYTQASNHYIIQFADIFGIYGVTFTSATLAGAAIQIFAYLTAKQHVQPKNAAITFVSVLMFLHIYGALRSHDIEVTSKDAPKIKLALLQGNIDQSLKMQSTKYRNEIMRNYIELAVEADKSEVDLIVWPEASYPRTMHRDTKSFKKSPIGKEHVFSTPQVIGIPLFFFETDADTGKEKRRLLNSSFLVSPELKVMDRYDKSHLVPFGEFVPLEKYLPIDKIVPGLGSFQKGQEVRPLIYNDMKFGILICYEGIFPEISREMVAEGAGFLLNITNDAWYGLSSAPFQHLSMYAVRAIETRRWVARATNTGISAFISANGKILQPTELFTKTHIVGEIDKIEAVSVYVLIGDVLPIGCWVLMGIFLLVFVTVKRKNK